LTGLLHRARKKRRAPVEALFVLLNGKKTKILMSLLLLREWPVIQHYSGI